MSTAGTAKRLYEERWRTALEAAHPDRFLAIDPESETYYLGDTFLASALAAKRACPGRHPFVLRIGHDAALHMGAAQL